MVGGKEISSEAVKCVEIKEHIDYEGIKLAGVDIESGC